MEFDFTKIYLSTNKNTYKILSFNNPKELIIKDIPTKTNFGLEKFNGKFILNVNLDYYKTLEEHNTNLNLNKVNTTRTVDNIFSRILTQDFFKLPIGFNKEFTNKKYSNSIRNNSLLRIQVKKPKVFKIIYDELTKKETELEIDFKEFTTYDIKNKLIKIDISLSDLWNYSDNYGITWNLDKIIIF